MNLSWTADGEPDERCLSLLRPPAPHRQARGLLRGVRVSDMTPLAHPLVVAARKAP